MNQTGTESCAICWRDFSAQVVPIALPCGHSFCEPCSDKLKHCAMCRKRIGSSVGRPRNYALISLLEKLPKVSQAETRDAQACTDDLEPKPLSASELFGRVERHEPKLRRQAAANTITFKLSQAPDGGLKCLGINFK